VIMRFDQYNRCTMGSAKPYHFKTQRSTFSLDAAPTSRARCRGCKGVIGKGETRLVTHAFVRPGRTTRFVRHVRCVSVELAREVLAVHRSIERVPAGRGLDAGCMDDARAWMLRLSQSYP
jgi:hypothetical protein